MQAARECCSPGSAGADAESGSSAGQDNAPVPLSRYDAVVGSDNQTPEILGRGFLAVVSIDPVTG
jgi:hypothetical protein